MYIRATFGAGCFWGVQNFFDHIPGVVDSVVGYGGGSMVDPTYQDVCRGDTNHAELIDLQFDPSIVLYEHLCDLFWRCHDPTQLNRQGVDVGTQYRSCIFTHSDEQYKIASMSMEKQQALRPQKIQTIIMPFINFYKAEEYHQHYSAKQKVR